MWEEPSLAAYMERLASFSRVRRRERWHLRLIDGLEDVSGHWALYEVVSTP